MAFTNPSNPSEVLYGASGDVRNEINAHVLQSTAGHFADETEIPGSLIIKSLVKSTRLINAFLEPVYADQLPFTAAADVPVFLEEISNDIATYFVWRSSHLKLGNIPEDRRNDYYGQYVDSKDGILTRISEKKLQIPELSAVSPSDAKSIRNLGRHSVFDLDADTQQGVDPNLLEDIAQDRDV